MNIQILSSETEKEKASSNASSKGKKQYKVEISSLKPTGTIPCCRSSFVAVFLKNNKIFIHGGTNEDLDLHDSYVLDLETLVWSSYLININYKLTLVGHSALLLNDNNILIFGGWDGNKYIDTSFLLNFDTSFLKISYYKGLNNASHSLKYRKQISSKTNLGNAKSWGGAKPYDSDIPASRRDHTLTLVPSQNKIYLFGGWNSINWVFEENEFNELWILDSEWRWNSDPTNGNVPPGRRGHSAVYVEEKKCIIIYGGVYGYNKILDDCYSLDIEKKNWSLIEYSPNDEFIPKGRAWHSACKINDEIFYIAGMLKNQEFSNEIISFNIFTNKWQQIFIDESPFPLFKPRCSQASILNGNTIYIMGGLGKIDQKDKDDYKSYEKSEGSYRNLENCAMGFNHIIKITIQETKLSDNNEIIEKQIENPSLLNEQKAQNKVSGVFSNPNSSQIFNNSETEGNEEAKNYEKNEFIPKKIHSVENLKPNSEEPMLKNNNFSDLSANKPLTLNDTKSATFNIKKDSLEPLILKQNIKSYDNFHDHKKVHFNKNNVVHKNWDPTNFPTEEFIKETIKKNEEFDIEVEKQFALKGITEKELPSKNEFD